MYYLWTLFSIIYYEQVWRWNTACDSNKICPVEFSKTRISFEIPSVTALCYVCSVGSGQEQWVFFILLLSISHTNGIDCQKNNSGLQLSGFGIFLPCCVWCVVFFSSVRDVIFQNFENYKPDVRELVCVADHLGSMMQYETPGFLPNKRIHRGILKDLGKFDWGEK